MAALAPFAFFIIPFLAAWLNARRGVLIVLFLLPSYVVRLSLSGIPTTALEMALLGIIAAWGIRKLKNIAELSAVWDGLKPLRIPILLFIAASIIAVFASPHTIPALGHWRAYILEPVLFALVFADTIKTEEHKRAAILTLALSLVIPTAVALYQQATGDFIPNKFWADAATRRVTSIYGYPNAYALYAVPVTVLFLAYMRSMWDRAAVQRDLLKKTSFLVPALGGVMLTFSAMASIFFTRSKGGIIALLAGMILLALKDVEKKEKAQILTMVAIIGIFLAWQVNFRGISTVQGGDSVSVRLTQYQETWEMLKDHPIKGAGLRGYQTAVAPYHKQKHIEIFMYPHNIFLAVWSELGILGLIAFVWIIIVFFKTTFPFCHSRENGNPDTPPVIPVKTGIQKQREETNRLLFAFLSGSRIKSGMTIEQYNNVSTSAAALAAMMALLIHGLVDVPYFKNDLAVLFWILIAITASRYPRASPWHFVIGQASLDLNPVVAATGHNEESFPHQVRW